MARLNLLTTLPQELWREFLVRYRFKYVLPKTTETTLEGIRLDLSPLSLKGRNRLCLGIYEAAERRLCLEFLRKEDAVLEIGGAIGFLGLVCQKHIGIENYFIFEANPATLNLLRRNYEMNGLQPRAWNLALGPEEGVLELDVATDFWENSVVETQSPGAFGQKITVPSTTLGAMLALVEQEVSALIIDVEGAEQFIRWDDLPASVHKIIIELHPKLIGAEKTSELIASLRSRGFDLARQEEASAVFVRSSP